MKPTVPGFVHGIVSLDPPQIQCDGCGLIAEGRAGGGHQALNLLILTCGIRFNPKVHLYSDRRRLCRECAVGAGWDL